MSRMRTTALATALGVLALTSCSSGSDEESKPITKQLGQGELTQAVPGVGELIPGWEPYRAKGEISKAEYCADKDKSPKGWVRGSEGTYMYKGSTNNMMQVSICLFDTPENAKSSYTEWKGKESDKEEALKKKVGDESVLVVNPGLSKDNVYGFSRSGVVTIRVTFDYPGGDTTGTQDMLATTLKRLQQVQDGKRATATVAEQASKADK
ncbi:hypothetical protein [Streptomyces albireticuli]|uniref:Lipoprotein n=1 Tax=Streptomyces albireticuli TaxID=1940 RepID=A0A2A2DAK7_9ACTN|nr:hypothetical protein [Streptomyces albireticuli]MCD9144932.1 hypothetical protein [Streptomyces albireticuli]MCD9164358.1 hypothetical protein [Streptomyces albireticuli]MCD9194069.1 hypothetical protein [Streptomyces albireticuli]PAU49508.1 hypothetical protein CK936_07495 [Streptomyces albireticuli]